ncbi:MAG: N-6 DNA methylase [Gemmatimonadota bacterium]|nr:N-6 DNA methylase [Gemmatimonadota bacterium]
MIIVLSKRKPATRKNKIVLLNASQRVRKGHPKNYIPEENLSPLAAAYLKGEPVEGEGTVITREQAEEADYNLSLNRWVMQTANIETASVSDLIRELRDLSAATQDTDQRLFAVILEKLQ